MRFLLIVAALTALVLVIRAASSSARPLSSNPGPGMCRGDGMIHEPGTVPHCQVCGEDAYYDGQ